MAAFYQCAQRTAHETDAGSEGVTGLSQELTRA
jgi:hypothetical protein